jgi:uncharacterized membrane protein
MYGFEAVTFDGKRTARKALDTLEDYAPAYVWIDDVAVLTRNTFGGIHVDSTWAQNDGDVGAGLGWGSITGGLIGMLFGPGGALAGAALGGSLGGLFGAAADDSIDDPRLDEFAESLGNDTSALILVGEKATLSDFDGAVINLGGKIVKSDLDEADIKKIRKALRAAS